MSVIDVRHVSKSYPRRGGSAPVQAVDDVSFAVERGAVVGLLGPNGAGKTTTIKMICGLVTPDSGSVRIAGIDTRSRRHDALRHIAAVLEGNRNLYWRLTARENLEYFAGNRGRSIRSARTDVDRLLRLFQLEAKADELVSSLSRGMQQKLAIAVALLAATDVILLDEPTLGLDVETGYEVREHLRGIARDEGRTVVISTHDMPVVQDLCERAVIIAGGRIVVDDRVEHLLRLFASRAYHVTLAHGVGAAQVARLAAASEGLVTVEHVDGRASITADLVRPEDVYALVRVLEGEGAVIESLGTVTTDFEAVFRKLVAERAPGGQRALGQEVSHA
ncbi:daunorubicin resistance protein DrrA family ABC transporter ATP-binding protein [soil metagenome]|nr:ABC transporter ATP-binding protein [Trueperaceae bacterium]